MINSKLIVRLPTGCSRYYRLFSIFVKEIKNMKKKFIKETSVLNTDSFDKRRFAQIFDMSERLQLIEDLGTTESVPMFKELLGDMWASLFRLQPKLKEEVPEYLQLNYFIMDKIMNEKSFQDLREKSKLDDMLSAIGTVRLGQETYEWLEGQKRINEELSMAMEEAHKQIEEVQQDFDKSDIGEQSEDESKGNDHALNQALAEFAQQLSEALEENQDSFSTMIGNAILCLDQSGSMNDIEEQSKAFTIAMMAIAKRQKRNCVYIPFDDKVGRVRTFPKGRITPNEIIEIAHEFSGGGTNFTETLATGLSYIKKDRYKDADIVFVTDGGASLGSSFLSEFNDEKDRLKCSVLSLAIGRGADTRTLELFSDKVVRVENFNEDGAFEAFEI